MGLIRPFIPEDAPRVAALRRKAFPHSEHATSESLASYLERLFFHNPWRDDGFPSLVYLDAAGRLAGFLGVVPRRAMYQGQMIRVAVSTQLMVDPAERGLAGVQLVKTFLAGRQDLSFADLATDGSRRIWEGLGGQASLVQSLYWTEPLRPSRYWTGVWSERRALRAPLLAIRPLCWAADTLAAERRPPSGLLGGDLTPATMAQSLPDLLRGLALRPDYDETSTHWLLEQLAAKRGLGALRGVALRDTAAALVGWYLYYANERGIGQIVQVAARKDWYGDVLDWMFHDAWRRGLTALTGRLEPALLGPLGERRMVFTRRGPWVLVHSNRRELQAALHRGDAFLSRLEGEWWMSF